MDERELIFVANKLVGFVREYDIPSATIRLRGSTSDHAYRITVEVRSRTRDGEHVKVEGLPGDDEMRRSGGSATPRTLFEGTAKWLAAQSEETT